jgi:23S rRNA A1618 N6-methylase RlmF
MKVLRDKVILRQSTSDVFLLPWMSLKCHSAMTIEFTMCNPPFYGSPAEVAAAKGGWNKEEMPSGVGPYPAHAHFNTVN